MRVLKINRDIIILSFLYPEGVDLLWRKVNDLECDESIYEWYADVVYFGIECSFGEGNIALK